MTGLERFIEAKKGEVAALERAFAEGHMPAPWPHKRPSFRETLTSHNAGPLAVIAEFKKASPSRGIICESLEPEDVARQYAENGASCLSILTEEKYFQGDMAYLERAAK
ncbi:MAG: indole-3-glycerol-phosphate synthase, partial [Mailhella sp.]|nr:indole-3-glycerol-phosphate synthase [Mailhella sp.]